MFFGRGSDATERVPTRCDSMRGVSNVYVYVRVRVSFSRRVSLSSSSSRLREKKEGGVPARRAGSVPVGWLVSGAADRSAGLEDHTRTSPLDIYL